jgi:hypothetical protein
VESAAFSALHLIEQCAVLKHFLFDLSQADSLHEGDLPVRTGFAPVGRRFATSEFLKSHSGGGPAPVVSLADITSVSHNNN